MAWFNFTNFHELFLVNINKYQSELFFWMANRVERGNGVDGIVLQNSEEKTIEKDAKECMVWKLNYIVGIPILTILVINDIYHICIILIK